MYHTDKVFHAERIMSGMWDVHSDLTREQIGQVEGVGRVFLEHGEHFNVFLDPRFDEQEVMKELHKLALEKDLAWCGGIIDSCGCKICTAYRELDNECKVEPRVSSCDCEMKVHVSFGDCTPTPLIPVYKVFLNGKPVEGKVELTEDVAIVPVRELRKAQSILHSIWQKTGRWSDHYDVYTEASEALGILKKVTG